MSDIRKILKTMDSMANTQSIAEDSTMAPGQPGSNKGSAVTIYPKAFPKRNPSPIYTGTDANPSDLAAFLPGKLGIAGALALYSGELNKGEDEELAKIRASQDKTTAPQTKETKQMDDIQKSLYIVDSMSSAEKKPTGPKFPGYWKGTDPASKAKSKMVGSAEESIIKDLHKTAKEKVTEWRLEEEYKNFNEEDTAVPTKPIWQDIHNLNADQIKDPNKIYAGQRLKLPDSDEDYVVQKGDTLSGIAKMYNRGDIGGRIVGGDPVPPPVDAPTTTPPVATPAKTGWKDIHSLNTDQIKDPNKIYAGQKLKLPNGQEYEVYKGDTLSSIAKRYNSGEFDAGDEPDPTPAPTTQPVATPGIAPAAGNKPQGTPGQRPTMQNDPRLPTPTVPVRGPTQPTATKKPVKPTTAQKPNLPPQAEPGAQAESFEQKFSRLMQEQSTTQSDLSVFDQGLSKVFGNLEKRDDGNWYFPGGVQVTDPKMIAKADASVKSSQAPATTDTSTPDDYGFWDATKDVVTGKKLPSQAYGPLVDKPASTTSQPSVDDSDAQKIKDLTKQSKQLKSQVSAAKAQMQKDIKNFPKGFTPDQQRQMADWDKAQQEKLKQVDALVAAGKPVDPKVLAYWKSQRQNVQKENTDRKIAGRYDPDEFDAMVTRLGQKAKEQQKRNPVDINALARRLWAADDKLQQVKQAQAKKVKEEQANATDPNAQSTNPTQQSTSVGSTGIDPKAQQAMKDQQVDVATAKGTVSGLKDLLGPQVDTNAAASGIAKANDGKPLNKQEQQSVAGLTPLMMKAAETPAVAQQLKTALSTAGMLSKLGK